MHTVEAQGRDWEELISGTKIRSTEVPRLVPIKSDPRVTIHESETSVNGNKSGNIYNNYVPILPKPNLYQSNDITNEEKYEFFNGGHFLSPKISLGPAANFTCELCDKGFESLKMLRFHIKQFHLGKFPYKCDFCFSEFAARSIYDAHMLKHKNEADGFLVKESLTLQDFPVTPTAETKEQQWEQPEVEITIAETENGEISVGEHRCDVCHMAFSTPNGLLRHKVRKHNQKTKKKYFIKGMKNARCDICNRDFSTQSYLQLHKKLHLKNGPSYKGKVFKNKNANYAKKVAEEEKEEAMEVDESKEEINDEVEIKEEFENKEEIKSEEEDEEEDVVMKEEAPNESSSSPGLKIKINLKNLKKEASYFFIFFN